MVKFSCLERGPSSPLSDLVSQFLTKDYRVQNPDPKKTNCTVVLHSALYKNKAKFSPYSWKTKKTGNDYDCLMYKPYVDEIY